MADLNKYQIHGTIGLTWTNDGLPMQAVAIPNTATVSYNWEISEPRDKDGNVDSRHAFNENYTVNLAMALRNANATTLAAAKPLLGPDAKVTLACSEDPDFSGDYMVQPPVTKSYTNTGEMTYNATFIRYVDNSTVTVLA